jgi:methionyl aminopeptidase
MIFRRPNRIEIKSPDQFLLMRKAGLVVCATLARLTRETGPGVTTLDLDRIAREELAAADAQPSFLGYYGYPAVICTSVNDEVVHGIPGERPLADGDIISIDFGAIVDGWHGDSAVTIEVGTPVPQHSELSRVTRDSMWAGLAQAVDGNRIGDIGHAVESTIQSAGNYGILEDYVGHGIGTKMHMEPSVPNFGSPGHGIELCVGMAVAIEPMVTLGSNEVRTLDDQWTVVTVDGSIASHWEHTVAITSDGPWVLTAADGGAAEFARMGVTSPAARFA